DRLIQVTTALETQFSDSIIQFFKDEYILNQNHIFFAVYHVLKSFLDGKSISNKKNIELLLYLSCNRQIRIALEAFGINDANLRSKKLTYCIISTHNNIKELNNELLQLLNANESDITLNKKSEEKFNKVKKFFELTNLHIKTVLKSFDVRDTVDLNAIPLENLFKGLEDLICEKMALLSLENI
ncbi:MAG: KEOPS complex subunit Cgi121, partial [Candidatus Lokiarchaeota archaeon]